MAETIDRPTTGLTWEEVCADQRLDDLPYKIETNEWGQIVMSPTRLQHGAFQFEIGRLLSEQRRDGRVVTESAVRTTKGVKVPDVAWFSAERWARVRDEFAAPTAPELCVEVLSPYNAAGEIEMKKTLYFEAGAQEVWTCGEDGRLRFFTSDGRLERSAIVPNFPTAIDV
jgi:Uma2 family endonuclease